jgi:endoglucanase
VNKVTSEFIHVNQIGYPLNGAKKAVVLGVKRRYELLDAVTYIPVWSGETLEGETNDAATENIWSTLDFTLFQQPGTFVIHIEGMGQSHPFEVSIAPYHAVRTALLKSFYYQRCGVVLQEEFAGIWNHDACHLDEGLVHGTEERRPSAGGWHDAGDYGKYVVPAAKAIADLLLAYEQFPSSWQESIGILESGNGIPDLLNESRFELNWLLLMQREDGAIYHKLTTRRFPGLDVMPEEDLEELVFSMVSYTATGTFAAAMAMSARVYRPFDSVFADNCLRVAEKAWNWLESAERIGFRNSPDIFTGEYGDERLEDERYWAAAELYRSTGNTKYLAVATMLAEQASFPLHELGWADVGGYGTIALLLAETEICDSVREHLLKEWMKEAMRLTALCEEDAFGISLSPEEYEWGSNMIVMNHAMVLILASRFSGQRDFKEYVVRHWDYLLGCNATDYCYITGYGSKRVMFPHHRPSVGDGIEAPVPGMVAGGPNKGLQDTVAKEHLQGKSPACCFVDHKDSYSTNEMTIYWNSPAVFVSAFMDSQFALE